MARDQVVVDGSWFSVSSSIESELLPAMGHAAGVGCKSREPSLETVLRGMHGVGVCDQVSSKATTILSVLDILLVLWCSQSISHFVSDTMSMIEIEILPEL